MARKPTRLSQNKKREKLRDNAEKARRTKLRRELNSRSTAPGELTPQQRVDAADHEARRWLGQHFLIDRSVILDALDAAAVTDGDRILEIGPGTGNLTVELVKAGAVITAVEKDRNLADTLRTQYDGDDAVTINLQSVPDITGFSAIHEKVSGGGQQLLRRGGVARAA